MELKFAHYMEMIWKKKHFLNLAMTLLSLSFNIFVVGILLIIPEFLSISRCDDTTMTSFDFFFSTWNLFTFIWRVSSPSLSIPLYCWCRAWCILPPLTSPIISGYFGKLWLLMEEFPSCWGNWSLCLLWARRILWGLTYA